MKQSKKPLKKAGGEKEDSKKPKLKPLNHKETKNIKNRLLSDDDDEDFDSIDDISSFERGEDLDEFEDNDDY